VFYIADNLTHPERFVSLELIDGKLKYQINLNPGLIDMTTVFEYVNTRANNDFLKVNEEREQGRKDEKGRKEGRRKEGSKAEWKGGLGKHIERKERERKGGVNE